MSFFAQKVIKLDNSMPKDISETMKQRSTNLL